MAVKTIPYGKSLVQKLAGRGNVPKSLGYKSPATRTNQLVPPYVHPFNSQSVPSYVHPLGQQTPGAQGAPAQGTQATPQVTPAPIPVPSTDPRDPTYWTNVGQLNFAYNNAVAQLGSRDIGAQTQLTNTLAELGQKEPIDQRHLRENYNDQGLFYSGHLGEATGNLISQYAKNRASAQNAYSTEHGDYLSQLDFLKGKLGFDVAAEGNASAQRQIDADTKSAGDNSLSQLIEALSGGTKPVIIGQTQQATTSPSFKRVPFTNSQGVKGFLHIYPNGKKVFVRG